MFYRPYHHTYQVYLRGCLFEFYFDHRIGKLPKVFPHVFMSIYFPLPYRALPPPKCYLTRLILNAFEFASALNVWMGDEGVLVVR